MKASKFTESQNAFILKQREEGTQVTEICQATHFNWKKRYGGLLLDEMRRLKALEDENGRPDLGPGDVAGRHPPKAPPDDQRGRLIGRTKGGHWLNNRVENSHQPFRRRERAMLRFRRMRSLQKFVVVHSSIHNLFNGDRALTSRDNFNASRAAALAEWRHLCAA